MLLRTWLVMDMDAVRGVHSWLGATSDNDARQDALTHVLADLAALCAANPAANADAQIFDRFRFDLMSLAAGNAHTIVSDFLNAAKQQLSFDELIVKHSFA
jgi:hypothetical protein